METIQAGDLNLCRKNADKTKVQNTSKRLKGAFKTKD